jgi:UTP-glucose-1-phosphate uridylyltransferase
MARRFTGTRFDCGSKAGFLAANVAFGRKLGLID